MLSSSYLNVSSADSDEIDDAVAQSQACLSALRAHAGLLRDLEATMRLLAASLEEAGVPAARRIMLAQAFDKHVADARVVISEIHRAMALGGTAGLSPRH